MDVNGTMERRFSLSNSPRLTNPIADSTWIDGMPVTQRAAARQLYRNLSGAQRSNSSSCLSNGYTNETPPNRYLHQTSRTSTSISKMTRQKLNLSQLDPKTYADVHSSGLTSRIAGYQQESSRGLQRSMSYNNVYNPMTLPRRIAPLNKRVLPAVSITHIAPPERSFFCGSTLPSLLRSNSLLGVEKNTEQLSRENRPIMHPPPLQHESEPTRSVLEELKEISRKRINSGEIQPNDFKKSCSRMTDYVDHHHHHPQQQQQHQQQQQQQLSMLQLQSGLKRQRELTVTVPLRQYHSPISLSHQLHQQQQQHHQQHHHQQFQMSGHHYSVSVSPEQLAKRRNCSHSNEIAGSLSSSKLLSSKRQLNSSTVSGSSSSSSPESSPRQQVAKIQRNQSNTINLHLEHLTRAQSVPITPLPATPAQRTQSAPEPNLQAVPKPETPAKPKLTLFNASQHQKQQQQQQQQSQREQEFDLDSPDVDASEYAGIQFVKPKQQNALGTQKNSNLERTQKTKLALMLSSLKGEIYQDETDLSDEPDAMTTPIKPTTIATTRTATLTTATATTTTTKPIILGLKAPHQQQRQQQQQQQQQQQH
ncbi:GH25310, isoform B [Drosophila grimshawi]|uniref:GH25310, isoform B n=1 Tax=Drosophila grimshawi TaxID=7222 RepID=B4JFI1_DROGR|nr:GH25310, isoform B [Drosophila grimshawi]